MVHEGAQRDAAAGTDGFLYRGRSPRRRLHAEFLSVGAGGKPDRHSRSRHRSRRVRGEESRGVLQTARGQGHQAHDSLPQGSGTEQHRNSNRHRSMGHGDRAYRGVERSIVMSFAVRAVGGPSDRPSKEAGEAGVPPAGRTVGPTLIADLARTSKLRVGINFGNTLLTTRDENGAPGGIAVDLAQELARRVGVPMELVSYDTAGQMAD